MSTSARWITISMIFIESKIVIEYADFMKVIILYQPFYFLYDIFRGSYSYLFSMNRVVAAKSALKRASPGSDDG